MSKFLFIFSNTPRNINSQEGFDALLTGSAFGMCSVLFIGDGVYQLLKDQKPEPLGVKNYALGFSALPDYDVKLIYCSKSQLQLLNVNASELIIPVNQLTDHEVNQLITQHDKVLSF